MIKGAHIVTNNRIARGRVRAAGDPSMVRLLARAVALAGMIPSAAGAAAPQEITHQGTATGSKAEGHNMRLLGSHDLQARSAYQPVIHHQGDRWILYVGHHGGLRMNTLTGVEEPNGTSILDVSDPRAPRLLVHI